MCFENGYYALSMESWMKTAVTVVAMAALWALGSWEASGLVSTRGEIGPTILQAQSPITSVLAVLITVGVASVVGGFVARISTANAGMLVFGFSLLGMAMRLDGIEAFVYGEGNFYLLMFEALFLSVLILLGTFVVYAIAGSTRVPARAEQLQPADFWKSVLISLVVIPIVYFIAISPLRGHGFGAALVGGIAVGVLSRQFVPHVRPMVFYALPIAIGGVGYLVGVSTAPVTDVAIAQQQISPLLFPMPIEYAAGVIIGVVIGLSIGVSEDKLRLEIKVTQGSGRT